MKHKNRGQLLLLQITSLGDKKNREWKWYESGEVSL